MPPVAPTALLRSLPEAVAKQLAKAALWRGSSCVASSSYDVVVLGAGAHGSATAWQLATRGQRVLCLEQFDFLHRRGSSQGDSRITRRTYPQAHFTAMMARSFDLWAAAELEWGSSIFTRTGGLDFGRAGCADIAALRSSATAHGLAVEILSADEVAKRFPGLRLPDGFDAVYSPDAGVLNATKAVSMMQELARRHGATLVDRSGNVSLHRSASGAFDVAWDGGSATAERVVVAAGGWTPTLLQRLFNFDTRHFITPVPVAVSYWRCKDAASAAQLHASVFPVTICYTGASTNVSSETEFYTTPVLEAPGLVKISLHLPAALWGPPIADMDARSLAPPTDIVARHVSPFVAQCFPGVDATAPALVEACVYTCTPDHDFIIDRVPGTDGRVVFVSACSGHGFKHSPAVGAMASELVMDLDRPAQPEFAVARFAPSAKL